MKIGLVQLKTTGSKQENLKKILSAIRVAERGIKLIVFPEYCMGFPDGGLNQEYLLKNAETLEGEFVTKVTALTKAKELAIILPIYEKRKMRIFNTAVVINEGEIRGCYRKIHLFDAYDHIESNLFQRGSDVCLFKLGEVTFGTVICYDIRFPELVKSQVLAGAEAVLVPAAWYKGPMKEEQWQNLLQARAQENTSYILGVGNAHHAFIGRTIVADPFGTKVLDLGVGEKIGVCRVDKCMIIEARQKLPVLKQSTRSTYTCRLI